MSSFVNNSKGLTISENKADEILKRFTGHVYLNNKRKLRICKFPPKIKNKPFDVKDKRSLVNLV